MKKTDKPNINVTININILNNLFSKNRVSTDEGISPFIAAFLIAAILVVSHFFPESASVIISFIRSYLG